MTRIVAKVLWWFIAHFVTPWVIYACVLVLLFVLGVRAFTLFASPTPELDSFDPKLRIAAAKAAAEKYGGKP